MKTIIPYTSWCGSFAVLSRILKNSHFVEQIGSNMGSSRPQIFFVCKLFQALFGMLQRNKAGGLGHRIASPTTWFTLFCPPQLRKWGRNHIKESVINILKVHKVLISCISSSPGWGIENDSNSWWKKQTCWLIFYPAY